MADTLRRRRLVIEDKELDCCLSFDVNEYLIKNYPTLTYKNRQSVWSICQNDDTFDWSDIEAQLDDTVLELAETDPTVVLPEEDLSAEPDEDTFNDFVDALGNYLVDYWDDIDEDVDELTDLILQGIDKIVEDYYDEDDQDKSDD